MRSKSQKSRSTSPMSEEAREVGGLIPTLTPTLTRAGGESAPGLVSGEELDTSEQLSSPMAERLRVATPEPKTYIPAARAVASTLAMRGTLGECRYRPGVPNSIITVHSLITTSGADKSWRGSMCDRRRGHHMQAHLLFVLE